MDERLLKNIIRQEISSFYADYCQALDSSDVTRWPDFFFDDCEYRLTTRENLNDDLELAFIRCIGKSMLRDRAEGLKNAVFYRERLQRRLVSGIQVDFVKADLTRFECKTTLALIESYDGQPSSLLVCGETQDSIVVDHGEYRFQKRMCIIDSDTIPDSLVYPL
ncbi:aromatic-ring-hydroxylating dioxygenase subunit beta [Teredinibacter sp. KSP-S5-2]|uniref:aromatic-ring-hydroxylating dioxygenase subunit beta n=1 Tax=Teredinibacter sp. KSP-S5-2 TaxID=3034506 RepID=UPI0029346B3E|nr:nuclear transport factor 2 family protein [Teredinibacter sp. KSP-S5-2]WNO10754.1 nuclear transport factor 2 family protein [Teredinibacter sp. KSP-S5-2]